MGDGNLGAIDFKAEQWNESTRQVTIDQEEIWCWEEERPAKETEKPPVRQEKKTKK